jgi:hypothetical protein
VLKYRFGKKYHNPKSPKRRKRLVLDLILEYKIGKKYHGVKKSMDVGIGCAPHSVCGVPPLDSILGWWGLINLINNNCYALCPYLKLLFPLDLNCGTF